VRGFQKVAKEKSVLTERLKAAEVARKRVDEKLKRAAEDRSAPRRSSSAWGRT